MYIKGCASRVRCLGWLRQKKSYRQHVTQATLWYKMSEQWCLTSENSPQSSFNWAETVVTGQRLLQLGRDCGNYAFGTTDLQIDSHSLPLSATGLWHLYQMAPLSDNVEVVGFCSIAKCTDNWGKSGHIWHHNFQYEDEVVTAVVTWLVKKQICCAVIVMDSQGIYCKINSGMLQKELASYWAGVHGKTGSLAGKAPMQGVMRLDKSHILKAFTDKFCADEELELENNPYIQRMKEPGVSQDEGRMISLCGWK